MRTWAKAGFVGAWLVAGTGCTRCGGSTSEPVDAGPAGPALVRVAVPVAAPGRAMVRVNVTREGVELDLAGAAEGWAPSWRDDAKSRQVEFTTGRHRVMPLDAGAVDAGDAPVFGQLLTALQNTLAMESRYGPPQSRRTQRVDLLVNPDVPPATLSRVWEALALANVARVGLSVQAGAVDGVLEVLLPQVSSESQAPQLGGPLGGVPEDAPLRRLLGATFTGAFLLLPASVPDAEAPWHGALFVSLAPDGLRWAELGRSGAPPAAGQAPDALRAAVERSLEGRRGHAEPESHVARLTVVRGTPWTAWVQAVSALEAPSPAGVLSPVWVAWAG
jgi:hypothetical protein